MDDAAQPGVGRVLVESPVPELVHGNHRRLDRSVDDAHAGVAAADVGKVARHRGDQVRAVDHRQQAHEVRQLHCDLAPQAALLKELLEHMLAPVRAHHGVRGGQVLLQRDALAHRGVAASNNADVRVVEQLLLKEAGLLQVGKVAHGEFGGARLQRLGRRLARLGHRAQMGRGRHLGKAGQQPGQEVHFADVGCEQGECSLGGGGVEARALQHLGVDGVHHPSHRLGQLQRARGGFHLGAGAHEEVVVEKRAQAGHRCAHGRLAQADGFAGARDAAVLDHRVEHHEQVQVDRFDIHALDSMYSPNRVAGLTAPA